MAMARDIPAPTVPRPRRNFAVLGLVLALVVSVAVIYLIFRNASGTDSSTDDATTTPIEVLMANPSAICYSHNPQYTPPKLVRNHYSSVFNDENDVQLAAARRNGIEALPHREVDYSKYGLVPLCDNEFYTVSELNYSVPYLVPAARVMLNTIGKCFQDVLAEKYPSSKYKIVVTSVLRTDEDVRKLVRRNRWATENSCHKHGTTVDISYHKYVKVSGPDVTDYEMKEFLAQALAELRDQKLCYVKYERRNCFHITLNRLNISGVMASPAVSAEEKGRSGDNAQTPAKVYKNKNAEQLHQIDEEKRRHNQPKNGQIEEKHPSPML